MDYIDFFTTDNKSGWKTREDRLSKNFPDVYAKLMLFINNNQKLSELPFKTKIWHFMNGVTEIPKCECGSHVKLKGNLTQGYSNFCSYKCSAQSKSTKDKAKETSISKYGVDHPSRSKIVRDKYKETCIEKYGVDNVSNVKAIDDKRQKTIMDKYGVNTTLKLPDTKDKLRDYSIKNYGVDHLSKSSEIKRQKKETLNKNHGVDNPMYSEELKEKQKETLIKNYGVDNPMRSDEIKDKCVNNMINTKFNNFIEKYDIVDDIVSWSGVSVTFNCVECDENYEISRELYVLRSKNERIVCTHCNPLYYRQSSYAENEIKEFIVSLGIKVENSDRVILDGKELDILMVGENLAIEFDGLYWHSELHVSTDYHLNKTQICESKGIQLIHIFEDEWLFKKEIVKSRLMNILGLTPNKIYARKCEIKEIGVDDARDFLDNNHIQGFTSSKHKLGLFYNDELVSLMTFGKGRVAMGGNSDQWELIRFCNKLDTTVIGGASKLLKYFIKTYEPNEIISYADRRWSNGGLYDSLGFDYSHDSKPNYWYVIGQERKHRFNFRKDKLIREGFDSSKSEHEIMLERGIYRIYDCGTMCFKFR
jgi:hypothetical protein